MRLNLLRAIVPTVSLFITTLALAACSKSKASTEVYADAGALAAAGGADAAGAVAMPAASVINPRLPLGNRLDIERANRPGPAVHPTSEEVFAAFSKAGAKLQDPKQHMASTYSARFCVGAKSPDANVALSVCEYGNEPDATAGKDATLAMFKNDPKRAVLRNKATTLDVIEIVKTPDNDALVKTLTSTFSAL